MGDGGERDAWDGGEHVTQAVEPEALDLEPELWIINLQGWSFVYGRVGHCFSRSGLTRFFGDPDAGPVRMQLFLLHKSP